jgi:hypothetical protein
VKYLLPLGGLGVIAVLAVFTPLAHAGNETKATVFMLIFAATIALGSYLDHQSPGPKHYTPQDAPQQPAPPAAD